VHPLDELGALVSISNSLHSLEVVRVVAALGEYIPPGPGRVANKASDALAVVPLVNGWVVELGAGEGELKTGYMVYISGDTLYIDELEEIPELF
ncbi:hypothetical protein HOY82DRAFT_494047, partial [Tuber indicum]